MLKEFMEKIDKSYLMKLAFKQYAIQNGYINNTKKYLLEERTDNISDRLEVFGMLENIFEIAGEVEKEGWVLQEMKGYDELLQVNKGFEYEHQRSYRKL